MCFLFPLLQFLRVELANTIPVTVERTAAVDVATKRKEKDGGTCRRHLWGNARGIL